MDRRGGTAIGGSIVAIKVFAGTAFPPPYIRLLVALFRGKDFLNGTPKNPQMEPHPRKAPKPLPELRIGLSIRPAAASSPDLSNQPPTPRLLDRLRGEIRVRHYSIRTESAYVDWTRRFILFHHKRHPQDMGAADVEAFLTYLGVERNVAAPAHSGRAAPRRGRWGSRCTTTWSRRSGGARRWRRSSVTMCAHVLASRRGHLPAALHQLPTTMKDENMKMTSVGSPAWPQPTSALPASCTVRKPPW